MSNLQSATDNQQQTTAPAATPADTTAPSAPAVSSPESSVTQTTTSLVFSGTAEASSTISTDFSNATTSANGAGAWTLSLTLPQGATAIVFYATDAAGNRSVAATKSVTVDSQAPELAFSAPTCSDTLVSGSCFVATTTLAFSWSSSSSDASYYAIDKNGVLSTTTATSTTVLATDQSDYVFRVSARDSAGNASATSTQTVTVFLMPVVINEVAWAGTAGSSADEWIELYNKTSRTLSLANMTLYADDFSPYLPLSGTIAPASYFLIERKNTGETNEATESSVIGVTADLWTSFGVGLKNSGAENLTLAWKSSGEATTTIDYVPKCGNNWCGGDLANYLTMERYDASSSGSDGGNWGTAISSYIKNGTDASGGAIKGTPKSRNGFSHLPFISGSAPASAASTVSANKTLTAARSPYLITFTATVNPGATLTLESGVVVKIVSENEPALWVKGTIKANGTAASPVVFTSFRDDAYGGDTNGDGSATTPVAGDWRRIFIDTTSAGSSFTHTLVRYGGNNNIMSSTAEKGAIGVSSATVSFDNLIVERSNFYGLALENSNSAVTNSRFSTSSNADFIATGLYLSGGAPSVSGSVFNGNYRGITLENSTAALTGNTITGSTKEALYATGALGTFSGNSGFSNFQNALVIGNGGTITASGATTTLSANSLPYLIKGKATVAENSTLVFGTGAIVKGHDSRANNTGELEVKSGAKLSSSGSSSADLVFTSIKDSSVGGETEAGLGSAAAADWIGVSVAAGGTVDLSGFTLRYGGYRASLFFVGGEGEGAFKMTGSAATSSGRISRVLFEKNYQSGLALKDVTALTVSNSTFSDHIEKRDSPATGLFSSNSTATLSNITWSGNEKDAKGSGTNALTCTSCGSPVTTPANLFSP